MIGVKVERMTPVKVGLREHNGQTRKTTGTLWKVRAADSNVSWHVLMDCPEEYPTCPAKKGDKGNLCHAKLTTEDGLRIRDIGTVYCAQAKSSMPPAAKKP